MKARSPRRRNLPHWIGAAALLFLLHSQASAGSPDLIPPAPVERLEIGKDGFGSVTLSWLPVDEDLEGGSESVDHYGVYGFPPSTAPWTVLGQTNDTSFSRSTDGPDEFFLVTATDVAGNEGPPWQVPSAGLPATFTVNVAFHDGEAIVSWSPPPGITPTSYRVYLGRGASTYQFVKEVGGTATSASTVSLPPGLRTVKYITKVCKWRCNCAI